MKQRLTQFAIAIILLIGFTIESNAQCPPEVIGLPMDFTISADADCEAILTWTEPTYSLECTDFEEAYEPANWALVANGQNGAVDDTGAPSSIVLTGSDDGTAGVNTNTDYCITIPCDGMLGFGWSATATGGGGQLINDEPAYAINGAETILNVMGVPPGTGVSSESGTAGPIALVAGDMFCFRVRSNNQAAVTAMTVTGFAFTTTQITQSSGEDNGSTQEDGVYPIEYEVKDCDGVVSTCSFTITVEDDTAPEIICPENLVDLVCLDELPVAATSRAEFRAIDGTSRLRDNCGGPWTVESVDSGTVDCNGGVISREYTATDGAGNTASCTQTFTFLAQTTDPVIMCSADVAVEGCTTADIPAPHPPYSAVAADILLADFEATGGTATDDCDMRMLSYIDVITEPGCPDATTLTIMRTYTLTDDCGNEATCAHNIVISDTTIPVIAGCPGDMTFECSPLVETVIANWVAEQEALILAASTDNCAGTLAISTSYEVPGLACLGNLPEEMVFTVTDVCGNIATCSILLQVDDTMVPELTCIDDIVKVSDPDICGAMVEIPIPSTFDQCGIEFITNSVTFTEDASSFYPVGVTPINFIAIDSCGNVSEVCSITVTVTDEIDPVLSNCPNDLRVCILDPANCDTTLYFEPPIAFENCGSTCFSGDLDVVNFAGMGTGNGFAFPLDLCSFLILGSDGLASGVVSMYDVCVTLPCDGELVYDWSALMNNGVDNDGGRFNNDEASIVINGVETILTDDPTANVDSGTETIAITAGDEICWRVNSMNRSYWTELTVSNFSFTKSLEVTQCSGPAPDSAPGAGDGDAVAPGVYEIGYIATDAAGNTSKCIFEAKVLEYEPDGLTCKDVNVSLNEDCMTLLTPDMLLAGPIEGCLEHYVVQVWDPAGNLISNVIDDTYLGQTLEYMVCLPQRELCCWGDVFIEDKFAPVIECEDFITTACNGLASVPLPTAVENCSYWVARLVDEEVKTMECDPDYITEVIRKYVAEDLAGNVSDTCTQTILLERIDLTDVECPDDAEVLCDSDYARDANGNPDPTVTGVPTSAGSPVFPNVPDIYCNSMVVYTDLELGSTDCTQAIMRVWEVREWWCSGELTASCPQNIKIVDETGPILTCPDNVITGTTRGYDCEAHVVVPPIVAVDACNPDKFSYVINYPGGVLFTNGGDIFVPTGEHVVTVDVTDICGNRSSCQFTVTVEDQTQPVAICEQNTVISIPTTNAVEVLAETFDDGSWDECGVELMEVARMETECDATDLEFGPSVHFCCSDVDKPTMVALRVTDYSGNTNICMATVTIQDKRAPVLTCPADMTVECTENFDFNNLSLTFGAATVEGNCGIFNITETLDTSINQCNIGTIIRTFTAADPNGNDQVCTQTIIVQNSTPFIENDITWPLDFETADLCDRSVLDPEDLDEEYAYPRYIENECELIGFYHEDRVFDFGNGNDACIKILRTWKVINWCSFNTTTKEFDQWEHEQVLKLYNTVAPTITGACESLLECSFNIDCLPGAITLTNSATDDCTDAANLIWTWVIDGAITGSGSDASGDYEVGVHTIEWTVSDQCGNTDSCVQSFEIRNCKPPIPICIQGLSAGLVGMDLVGNDMIPDAEMVTIWASDFDGGSYHTCGNPIEVSFSEDITNKSLTFDCDDIGEVRIELWVTDVLTGAQDFCETFIDIQDNNDVAICPPSIDGGLRIAGDIRTEDDRNVREVEVELDGANLMEMTNLYGRYDFPYMPSGGEYTVDPKLDKDYLNGVSTLDLVLIQRHVLGLEPLDSPYKLIAADVNKDNQISAIDILELRKLILGIYEEFPDNESWRFVDEGYSFIDPTNPFAIAFDEAYYIYDLNSDMEVDFIGMKIGDVNETVSVSLTGDDVTKRSNNNVSLEITDQILEEGKSYHIDVLANDVDALKGIQFGLSCNNKLIEVQGIESGFLKIDASNYALNVTESGDLNFSWHNLDGANKSIDTDQAIFSLNIVAKARTSIRGAIEISEEHIMAEAYDGSEIKGVQLEFNSAESYVEPEVTLFQNTPNPWSEQTTIKFYLPESDVAELRVLDANGRLLKKVKAAYQNGINEIRLNNDELNASGVVVYELIYREQIIAKRMVLLK